MDKTVWEWMDQTEEMDEASADEPVEIPSPLSKVAGPSLHTKCKLPLNIMSYIRNHGNQQDGANHKAK